MSNSFLKYVKYGRFIVDKMDLFNVPDTQERKFQRSIITCVGLILMGIHFTYTLGTTQAKTIQVYKKYTFTRNGFTEFMIIDKDGEHYNVSNSIWYWKWNSIEDWHKIDTTANFTITYYGWRLPLFGIFPNIVKSSNAQELFYKTHKLLSGPKTF